jgi:hypothetical protein
VFTVGAYAAPDQISRVRETSLKRFIQVADREMLMTRLANQSTKSAGSLSRRGLILRAALISSAALPGARSSVAAQDESLRDLADRKRFTIGALCTSGRLGLPPDANALGREFNTAIIEGISRLAWDHPSQPPPVGAQYEWQAVDHCMEFVEQHGMRVQAHHLA